MHTDYLFKTNHDTAAGSYVTLGEEREVDGWTKAALEGRVRVEGGEGKMD